jgi:hypothetical protein
LSGRGRSVVGDGKGLEFTVRLILVPAGTFVLQIFPLTAADRHVLRTGECLLQEIRTKRLALETR